VLWSDLGVWVQAGIALTNARLYQESERARGKVNAVLEVIKAMHNNFGISSLMFTITTVRKPSVL
jgi:hypothetical protein